ncbi:MAG: DMT family transporter [Rhodospirillaceae bacterium]
MSQPSLLRRVVGSPYFILVLPPLFWAGNAVAGRVAMDGMSPYALSFWRWALALALLLPFTLTETLTAWPVIKTRLGRLFVLGALSVGAYNTFLYMALQTTEAINATLVGAVMPLIIMVLSFIVLREPLGLWRSVGLVASIAGVALVIARGDVGALAALQLHQGDAFMLIAVMAWGLFSVLLRRWPLGLTGRVFLTVQMVMGLVVVTVLYLGDLATGGGAVPMTWEAIGIIVYTAVFPALGAYFAWNYGVAKLGANVAGFYTNLVPLFTALLAAVLLNEAVQWFHGIGLALIFLGIGLATLRGPAAR